LFVGPAFTRQAAIAPRRVWFFAARTVFVAALFGIVLTSWQLLVGSQRVENLGDLAWFGAAVTRIVAPLQLAVAMPFSALLVASAVALEKDRKTLELLLMSDLTNSELVLGKLMAGMLTVIMVVAAALPLLMLVGLLGGVSIGQIVRIEIVTLASALAAGSLGSTIALWREKTFQALAMTALLIVLWLVAWEIVATGVVGNQLLNIPVEKWAVAMSPWRAIQAAAEPVFGSTGFAGLIHGPVGWYALTAFGASILFNLIAITRVRVWNPTREIQIADDTAADKASDIHRAPGRVRRVWDNPVLWREIRTKAYGKRVLIVRLAYWIVVAVAFAAIYSATGAPVDRSPGASAAAQSVTALLVVSLILLNSAAVTAITSERDGGALDLLLVTDLSPKEIVFGKLIGAFYTAKEMVFLPLALFGYLLYCEVLTMEQTLFLAGGWAVMTLFAATLGLHAGITYANSRTAIATSLGTLLFLFLGVATCMRMMLAFNAFEYQLTSFLGFIAGGGVGLFVALGWRNASQAIFWASLALPFATFFVITSYLLGDYDRVMLVTVGAYGFAVAAMLVPAVSEFDVALGRTVLKD
jgi:ABC-type transport system involved in multi-copper enzyme maturation permease subunit